MSSAFRTPHKGYLKYLLRYKIQIALTYGTSVLASILVLFYPYATGLAVDGALANAPWAVLPLVVLWIAHLIVDGFRQIFDTRTFSRVFADAVVDMVRTQKGSGQSTSEVAARVKMMEDLTLFLGLSLPEIITWLIAPVGGLVILFALSPLVAVALLAFAVVAVSINVWLFPKLKDCQATINSLHENNVSSIDGCTERDVGRHYEAVAEAFVRLSDLNAVSWMLIRGLGLAVIAFGILMAGAIPETSTGEVYSMVAYVWRVLDGIFLVPAYTQQFAHLLDVWRRITLI